MKIATHEMENNKIKEIKRQKLEELEKIEDSLSQSQENYKRDMNKLEQL